ncbi:CvpA family protein [Rhodovibrio salinarum]|uniref:Membrane protein required for colicin V production n=1 Tax=Rhodovibrio salinarum TaxID=1087 RepID=A0A934QK58_9PROT|nr:CvpA family protein [Rhodovibrio salinarum]MBK1698374.1 hypothetical protein [Rhodovibrio salinarum]
MADLPINFIDIAVLTVLLLSGALAFMRGCVHEVLSVGAWVGAGLATLYGFETAQPFARDIIAIDLLADIVAGVVIFVVTLVVLSIISRVFSNRVRESSLGALDRSLGLVFGLVRGVLLVAVAWMLMTWALPNPNERPSYLQEAKSARLVAATASALESALPESLRHQGSSAAGQAQQGAKDAQDLKDAYDVLSRPKTEAQDPKREPGYNEEQRQDLDRLFENQASENGSGEQ